MDTGDAIRIFLMAIISVIMVTAGIDLWFNNATEINFWTCFKLNALSTLLFLITSILVSVLVFNIEFISDDTAKEYTIIITIFILMYFIKTLLIRNYELDLSGHFLVTLVSVFILALPYYIPYLVLKGAKGI